MKKFSKWFIGIILVLFIAYSVGPKLSKPVFATPAINLPVSLNDLEEQINLSENSVKGIKPDNQARIIWADTSKKEKTKIAFLYLHGFLASQAEGDPVHKYLAKKFDGNLYLARLSEHGINRGDSTLIGLNADDWIASAERALEITKKLGDEVVVIGTSAGGVLTLYLASHHPEIKAIVLFSPCVKLYNNTASLLNKPWGLQIGKLASGGPFIIDTAENKEHENYWTLRYPIESVAALVNLYSSTMKPDVLSAVKCPVFMGYYYKNTEEQDKTASVAAMLKMFDELGTPEGLKQKTAFPEAGAHVFTSQFRKSNDWKDVESETDKFLTEIVKL